MKSKSGERYLTSVKGQTVAITGKCFIPQDHLAELVASRGGATTPKYRVTKETSVLVCSP